MCACAHVHIHKWEKEILRVSYYEAGSFRKEKHNL